MPEDPEAAGGKEPGCISSELIHDGRVVHLSVDRVRFPDGSTGRLELIRHRGAAAVLPLMGDPNDPDPDVLLVHQYRYAAGGTLYEVPAGLRDSPDESWESCAARELEEETGYRAGSLTYLTRILTTPGFTDEVIHLFVGRDLVAGTQDRDPDEFLEVVRMPLSKALSMVGSGEIVDCKSIATLLYYSTFGTAGKAGSAGAVGAAGSAGADTAGTDAKMAAPESV